MTYAAGGDRTRDLPTPAALPLSYSRPFGYLHASASAVLSPRRLNAPDADASIADYSDEVKP